MATQSSNLSVRSVSAQARQRLAALKHYTRLPYGALLEDCVEALWNEYVAEGHDLPEAPQRSPQSR